MSRALAGPAGIVAQATRGKEAMPDFAIERRCRGLVCGIDEAGRGPLAGPVVAAAVILEPRRLPKMLRDGLDDSKVLTRVQREGSTVRFDTVSTAALLISAL